MKILGVFWFTGQQCIGIARVEYDYDGIQYKIAAVPGNDEEQDAQYIADWGSSFHTSAGDVLFGVKTCN